MNMRYDEEELERLLAGGYLGGAQYDRIESRVMQRVARAPGRRRLSRAWAGLALITLGGLVMVTRSFEFAPGASGFTAKGARVEPAQAAVELVCSDEPPRAQGAEKERGAGCIAESTLIFVVNSDVASGYLSARAERIDPPSHERIWLFPAADGTSPHVAPDRGTTVVPQGIRLASLPGPGVYRVDFWFSDGEPAREERRERSEQYLQLTLRR